jgi:diguanylate cyclase (GGDEF)-like protein
MDKFIYNWRYYSYGLDKYNECMSKVFITNLNSLRQANTLVAVFSASFTLFTVLYEKNMVNAAVYFSVAVIAFLFSLYLNYIMQRTIVSNRFIYVFSTLFYVNVMIFGIYLGVWATPEKLATIFLCLLICALLMFINPPLYNLILTISAIAIFITCSFFVKNHVNVIYDIVDTIVAGSFSIFFNWYITKLRMGLEISTTMLEEERNKYLDQSTTDELTQLNNRRDFMSTFGRYLSNYRTSDNWLCVAICDIDFFKNYNDHYGHPMGDTCLRSIGVAFNKLKEIMGIYVARVGGEEFAILWFEEDAAHVNDIVSCLYNLIKEMNIPHEKSSVSEFITMSIGIYIERLGKPTDTQTLYNLSDKALYEAKGSGRKRAVITGSEIERYVITADS